MGLVPEDFILLFMSSAFLYQLSSSKPSRMLKRRLVDLVLSALNFGCRAEHGARDDSKRYCHR